MKTFDKRDGAEHAHLQFRTWSEILGLPWNATLDRSSQGYREGQTETEMQRLIHEAELGGETILAAAYSNYAVSIAVKAH